MIGLYPIQNQIHYLARSILLFSFQRSIAARWPLWTQLLAFAHAQIRFGYSNLFFFSRQAQNSFCVAFMFSLFQGETGARYLK
jgi:hypothetical protein